MADPAYIEALQAERAYVTRIATRTHALRQLLTEFDPQPGDAYMDYHGLLQRAEAVIATALTDAEG